MSRTDQITPLQSLSPLPAQPEMLGRYKLLEELGQGGMSVVYRALDTALDREVAVKLMHSHLAKKTENRQRFHREARAIAKLRHPAIVEVYDLSPEGDELAYIVMEYIRGRNLRQFLEERCEAQENPPAEIVAAIALILCRALEHAHEEGVIHRDLKPENVMVCTETATVKLMDFGIAHVIGAETMTQTGSLLGSPSYMAPELIEGRRIDRRSDIFSLGSVLYWSATGRLAFDGTNAPQVLKRVLDGHFDDPEEIDPRIGHDLAAIIGRCLANNPDERFQDARSLRTALESFLNTQGYSNDEALLTHYIQNPSTFTFEFIGSVVPKLVSRGQRALREGSISEALGCFNRVLAYEPENEAVADLLAVIGRKNTYRRTLAVLGGTVVVALVISAALLFSWQASVSEEVNEGARAAAAAIGMASNTLGETTALALAVATQEALQTNARAAGEERARLVMDRAAAMEAPPRQVITSLTLSPPRPVIEAPVHVPVIPTESAPEEEEAPPAEAAPATELYQFKVLPPAATLSIGERTYSAIEAARGIELPHGRHRLMARSQGCKAFTRVIDVRGPQKARLPIVLEWEEAQIQIMTNHDALVWINADPQPQMINAFGENASLRIPFGKADTMQSEREVRLRIAPRHDLQQSRTQVVTLRPGIQTTVNVNFNAGP